MKYISTLLLIAGLCLIALLVRHAGPSVILETFGRAEGVFILAGLLVYALSILSRASKWGILINVTASSKIPFRNVLPVYLLNSMLSYFTPVRSGDAAAPLLFKRHLDTFIGSGFSAIIIDRLLETAFLFLGMLVAGVYFHRLLPEKSPLLSFLLYALFVCLAVFAAAAVLFLSKKTCKALLQRAEEKQLPAFLRRFTAFLRREGGSFYEGVTQLGLRDILLKLLPLTVLAWSCDLIAVYCFFRSVMHIEFLHLCMTLFLSSGIALVSFIPGGLGSGELSLYYFLSVGGYAPQLLAAGILITRFVPLGLIALSGLSSFCRLEKRSS